jgi:hypothetical protein
MDLGGWAGVVLVLLETQHSSLKRAGRTLLAD